MAAVDRLCSPMSGPTGFQIEVARLFSLPASDGFVLALAKQFSPTVMLERAAEIDHGLDLAVLASMMRTVGRFSGDEIPIATDDVDAL